MTLRVQRSQTWSVYGWCARNHNYGLACIYIYIPAVPNYPFRHPKYRLIEIMMPSIEVLFGGVRCASRLVSPDPSGEALNHSIAIPTLRVQST